jgi:4-hydroxysphinganine ceramide fatty acyl 2-hydroxylase
MSNKLYVSSRKETPRMFQSSFMEFFSRVHWTVPLWVFVPVIGIFLFRSVTTYALAPLRVVLVALAGVLFWTITEYLMHRFVFHFHPTGEFGKKIIWTFHGVHHDYPSDPLRLVMPPSVSLPLATLFYLLFLWVLGPVTASAFMPGFLVGYLFYDITHFAVHHFPIKGRIFGTLRELHMRHHFKNPDAAYGVSSPFWDYVFRTTIPDAN